MAILFTLALFMSTANASTDKPNDLVQFLTGKWNNVSFEISDGKPVKREAYPESVLRLDCVLVRIFNFRL